MTVLSLAGTDLVLWRHHVAQANLGESPPIHRFPRHEDDVIGLDALAEALETTLSLYPLVLIPPGEVRDGDAAPGNPAVI